MILFPATLIADAVTSLKNARIGYQTWLRDLLATAITVSSETAAGPRDAPLRPDTYEFWEPSALPAYWIADLGQVRDIDYVGILGSIGSNGAAVEVRHSLDGEFDDYIDLPGAAGNYLSTPDSAAVSVTGTLKLRAKIHTPDLLQPEFFLPLRDAGSGVVDIALHRGTGSATFTRATAQTTTGPDGEILLVGSGDPCSACDPVTLEYRGYIARGARTNLCLQSENLATTWANVRSTESVNATVSPDGASTADKIVSDATAASSHYVTQAITFTNVVHTFSVFCKAAEKTWAFLNLNDGTTNHTGYFDLVNGVVGSGSNTTRSIQAFPNGWYRCSITTTAATAAAAGSMEIHIAEANNDASFDGNSVDGIFAWGAQLEAATFASSYIPTTTGSVAVNADVLTYAFSGNADATQGTAYAELGVAWSVGVPASVVAIGFDTSAVGAPLFVGTAANSSSISINDGTSSVTKSGLSQLTSASGKRVSSWGAAGKLITGEGATVASGAFDGSMGSAGIGIGCGTGGAVNWFGTLKNIGIYSEQLPVATVQLMTTEVYNPLIAKWVASGNQKSYALTLQPGPFLALLISPDGSTKREFQSIPLTLDPIADTIWVEAEFSPAAGSPAMATCTFRESSDGVTFNDLGDPVVQTETNIFDGTAPLEVGGANAGVAFLDGRVFEAEVYEDDALVASFDAADAASESATTITSSTTGEVWTIHSSGVPAPELVLHSFMSPLAPADDAPIMALNSLIPARYLGLFVTGTTPPRITNIYAGVALAMPYPIYGGHAPINLSRETELTRSLSRGGQFLGQGFRRLGVKTSLSFRHLPAAWYRANFDPFVKSARRYPFFLAWRPQDYPLEVGYVWCQRDIAPSNMGKRDWMQVGFEVSGVGNE